MTEWEIVDMLYNDCHRIFVYDLYIDKRVTLLSLI